MTNSDPTTLPLFEPLTLRDVTMRNRIGMSPMCTYSTEDGAPTDWHLVHLGARAAGGAGLIVTEATSVAPEGRISNRDCGLWSDDQIEPWRKITDFIREYGSVSAVQLAHAGRKAGHAAPWLGAKKLPHDKGGWQSVGVSAQAFRDGGEVPIELDAAGVQGIADAFVNAARRACEAGFDAIELHSAHGYLLHSFLSPLSNFRTDDYGGSVENRCRLLVEIAGRTREQIPDGMPLLVRISATDWVEGGWDIEQSITLARMLKVVGVDLIDCSTGGATPDASIPVEEGFQVRFAEAIRREADIASGAVGMITRAEHANEIVRSGAADVVLLGRELLRDPQWPVHAQVELGAKVDWPTQYGWALDRK